MQIYGVLLCPCIGVLSICRRSNCGDGGIAITDAEADLISEKLEYYSIATISVRMVFSTIAILSGFSKPRFRGT